MCLFLKEMPTIALPFSAIKNNMTTYSHSGNLGDIIWSLPTVKHFGGGEFNLIPAGIPDAIRKYNNGPVFPEYENRLSQRDFAMIAPLLEAQPYITKLTFEKNKKFDYDLDLFRATVGQGFTKNFIETFAQTFNTPVDYNPWLTVTPKKIANFVITRTLRYHSPKTTAIPDWIKILRENNVAVDGIFVGLPEEHDAFQKLFCIQVPYYKVNNFLELAEVIAGADTFISNATFAYGVAQGLGKKTVLELRSAESHIIKEGCHYF